MRRGRVRWEEVRRDREEGETGLREPEVRISATPTGVLSSIVFQSQLHTEMG